MLAEDGPVRLRLCRIQELCGQCMGLFGAVPEFLQTSSIPCHGQEVHRKAVPAGRTVWQEPEPMG